MPLVTTLERIKTGLRPLQTLFENHVCIGLPTIRPTKTGGGLCAKHERGEHSWFAVDLEKARRRARRVLLIFYGVLLVIVLSAIMSTVDSLLLLASSSIVRDTMQKILGSPKSDATLAGYGKIVTVIIGVIAVFVAVYMAENKLIF